MKKILYFMLFTFLMLHLVGCGCKHDWQEATCTTPKKCAVCDETKGKAIGHNWKEATCITPKTCTLCEETKGEALGHAWENATCISAKTCTVCKETEGEALGHNWKEATCQTPKTCETCNITEGNVINHNWKGATCTTPKKCSMCNKTEGSAIGHNWSEATCTSPKTCTTCNATEGQALEHNFVRGVCAYCDNGDSSYFVLASDACGYIKKSLAYPHSLELITASAGMLDGKQAVSLSYFALDGYGKRQWYVKRFTYAGAGNINSWHLTTGNYEEYFQMSIGDISIP